MKVVIEIDARELDLPTLRHLAMQRAHLARHRALESPFPDERNDAIKAIQQITERPDEIGESFIWCRLQDCYMPMRRFIENGHSSKWTSAEGWERNPWFP